MEIPNLIWSWWVRDLAVGDGTATWLSGVDRRGHIVLNRIAGGTVDRLEMPGATQADDHNAAALWVDPIQPRLLVAGSRHNKDSHVRLWTVDRDTLDVDGPVPLEMGGAVSYAQILSHGSNTLHLLCRREMDQWVYRTSADAGLTWSQPRVFFDASGLGQVYVTTRVDPADPALVHFAAVGHPAQQGLPDVGYGRIRLDTGAVTTLAGVALGNLGSAGGPAVQPDELDQAVVPSGNYRVRLLEVGVVDGQPAIAYAVWNTANPDYAPNYKVKRWTGSQWDSGSWSLPAGQIFGHTPSAHYHGGVTFAANGNLWTARHDGTDWLIEAHELAGNTWSAPVLVARRKTRLLRPYAVHNPVPGGPQMVYQDTFYEHYTRYYGDAEVS